MINGSLLSEGGGAKWRLSPQGAARPFSLQYTALILIILTFVVGAFSEPETSKTEAIMFPQPARAEKAVAPAAIARVEYDDLFSLDSDEQLNDGVLAALLTLLRSHDLRATIEIFSPQAAPGDGPINPFGKSLARSVTLFRALVDSGVPAGAVIVRTSMEVSTKQARVIFSHTVPNG